MLSCCLFSLIANMLRGNAQDHGALRHNSSYLYTALKVDCEADIAFIERVNETLKAVPTDDIRKFAAVSLLSLYVFTLNDHSL